MDVVTALGALVWVTGALIGFAASKRRGYPAMVGTSAGMMLGPLFAWVLFLGRPRLTDSAPALIIAAFVFGAMHATSEGLPLGRAEWLGAAMAPLMLGVIVGGVGKIFARTSIPRAMFWASVIFLVIDALHASTS